ncbi:hypothetical protein [Sagittula sp. SSi028]|uniref:hypothetical protein n=1 Tax=Sagittula sp. SSi028 TaxID=3400636 RepID=UPI003AF7D081
MALKHMKFITSILSIGALVAAVTAAAPARAENYDGAKIFLGTAATIWLLHELNQKEKSKSSKKEAKKKEVKKHAHAPAHKKAAPPRGHAKPALPRQCLRDTRRQGLVMGQGCLNRNYKAVNRLPNACRTVFRANGDRRNGFQYNCLSARGYALARR